MYQLKKAKVTGGFMIQVAEFDQKLKKHVLGNGQQIETELAGRVGVKVFRVYQEYIYEDGTPTYPCDSDHSVSDLVDEIVKGAQSWLESDREDMTVHEIHLKVKHLI